MPDQHSQPAPPPRRARRPRLHLVQPDEWTPAPAPAGDFYFPAIGVRRPSESGVWHCTEPINVEEMGEVCPVLLYGDDGTPLCCALMPAWVYEQAGQALQDMFEIANASLPQPALAVLPGGRA